MLKSLKPKFAIRRYVTLLELLISMVLAVALLSSLAYIYQQVNWINTQGERLQKEEFKSRYVETRLNRVFSHVLSEYDAPKNFYFFSSNNVQGLLSPENPSLLFIFNNGANLDTDRAYHVLGRLFVDQDKRLCLATMPAPAMWKENVIPNAVKEVLLDHVETLAFEFYVPPERNREKVLNHTAKAKAKKKANSKQESQTKGQTDPHKQNEQPTQKNSRTSKQGQKQTSEPKEEKLEEQPPTIEEFAQEEIEPDVVGAWQKTPWKRAYNHLPPMIKIHITQKRPDLNDTIKMTYAFPLPRSGDMIIYE